MDRVAKNWPKCRIRLPFTDFIAFAYAIFLQAKAKTVQFWGELAQKQAREILTVASNLITHGMCCFTIIL